MGKKIMFVCSGRMRKVYYQKWQKPEKMWHGRESLSTALRILNKR